MGKIFDALERAKKDRGQTSEEKAKAVPDTAAAEKKRFDPARPKTKRTSVKNLSAGVNFSNIHQALSESGKQALSEEPPRPTGRKAQRTGVTSGDVNAKNDQGASEQPTRPTTPRSDQRSADESPNAGKPDSGAPPETDRGTRPRDPASRPAESADTKSGPMSSKTGPMSEQALALKGSEAKVIDIKPDIQAAKFDIRSDTVAARNKIVKAGRPTAPSVKKQKPLHQKLAESLLTFWRPQSVISEQFKKLRTNILFSNANTSARSVLVSSAAPEEGKSFMAANLAISIAQNINEHVLLIDCDLRNPTVHRLFGYNAPPGLSDYLTDREDMPSLLLKTQVHKLTILPSGNPPDNPSELLSSEKMKNFLQEARERYSDRYIIIDTPPPQISAETIALAKHVDGVLLLINSGRTRRDLIEDTVEMFGRENILGVVFNRSTATSKLLYGYSRKYHHYGKDAKRPAGKK